MDIRWSRPLLPAVVIVGCVLLLPRMTSGLPNGKSVSTESPKTGGSKFRLPEKDTLSPELMTHESDEGFVYEDEMSPARWVMLDDTKYPRPEGESMDTANSVLLRPMFRYRDRAKQASLGRRRVSSRRRNGSIRPVRRASYYRPYYYQYYPVYRQIY